MKNFNQFKINTKTSSQVIGGKGKPAWAGGGKPDFSAILESHSELIAEHSELIAANLPDVSEIPEEYVGYYNQFLEILN